MGSTLAAGPGRAVDARRAPSGWACSCPRRRRSAAPRSSRCSPTSTAPTRSSRWPTWSARGGSIPFTQGYIAQWAPGDLTAVGPLHGTHEPPFYVAGSDHWVCGYMEGAVRTGRSAASALLGDRSAVTASAAAGGSSSGGHEAVAVAEDGERLGTVSATSVITASSVASSRRRERAAAGDQCGEDEQQADREQRPPRVADALVVVQRLRGATVEPRRTGEFADVRFGSVSRLAALARRPPRRRIGPR